MKLPQPLKEVTIIERVSRFSVRAIRKDDDTPLYLHLPNSGRLREVIYPGARSWYKPFNGNDRKTDGTLVVGETPGSIKVGLMAAKTSWLFHEAWLNNLIPDFPAKQWLQMEPRLPHGHRLDVLYMDAEGRFIYVETKSITYVENGTGYFPDAPTERGRRHLESLLQLKKQGHLVYLSFIVQREDAVKVAVRPEDDPSFYDTLLKCMAEGLPIIALRCQVTLKEIKPVEAIPFFPE